MDDFSHTTSTFRFGEFELQGATEQLLFQGERVKLEPQQFSFLLLLLSHRGELVKRQRIQDAIWDGRLVSDEAIRAAIKKLRDVLGDDARAPEFIKTIPKQGYKWIGAVEELEVGPTGAIKPRQSKVKTFVALGLAAALLFVWWLVTSFSDEQPQTTALTLQPELERLTSLPGSEVFAHYHNDSNMLVFLHRDARNSPQQLYIKNLNNGEIRRLSWDDGNYTNTFWSNDGRKLAFNRLVGTQDALHVAHFDENAELTKLVTVEHPALTNKFVVGWLHDQSGLLLAEEMRSARQHRIYQYTFADESVSPLSSPNVAGRGDYLAAQSFDGSKLAILREVSKLQTSVLIMESETGRMLANKTLPFLVSRMSWQHDDAAVIMTSFYGQTLRYQLATDFFDEHPKLPGNSLDIYASCGDRCYILRQHNGNFLDIQETPLHQGVTSSYDDTTPPVIESGRLLRMAGAQDFPLYTGKDDELMFVSLVDQSLVFQKLDAQNNLSTLGSLQRTFQLSSLAISKDASTIAGVADGRLFILAAEDADRQQAPAFKTNALEQVANPVWQDGNRHLYLTQFADNSASVIRYDIESGQRALVLGGVASFRPLPDNPDAGVAIDMEGKAWRVIKENGVWTKQNVVGAVPSPNPHRWKIAAGKLYFSTYSSTQSRDSQLCWLALEGDSKTPTCRSTGQNRFRLHFDIHPTRNKVLLVESLSAESDIIRFSW